VLTCPTGIDIRDGLQMECIHCTQCMDACDAVMVRVGKPRGLIRYSSRAGLEGLRARITRPRVVIYAALLAVMLGIFVWSLGARSAPDVALLHGMGEPYELGPDGSVMTQVRLKVTNRGRADAAYRIALQAPPGVQLVAPVNPLAVSMGRAQTTSVFIVAPRSVFADGECRVAFVLSDGARWRRTFPYRLAGPEPGDGEHRPGHGEERR
jgi:polyferredoxin